jgi:peptidoglycan hydrolase-like protein with peptidoglycan-binding domain
MADSGIPRIDQLYLGAAGAQPITPSETDATVVSALQDLLIGHDYQKVRNARDGTIIPKDAEPRGVYGKYTRRAVRAFRQKHHLVPVTSDAVDRAVLSKLIEEPMANPIVGRVYVTRVLDQAWSNDLFLTLHLIGAWEGGFARLNLGKTDKQGLSFGILQWTQRSGRLYKALKSCHDKKANVFRQIFGGPAENAGSAPVSDGLLANTKKCFDSHTLCAEALDDAGHALDVAYRLNQDQAWIEKFKQAGLSVALQKAQLAQALIDLRASLTFIRGYVAGLMHSQRGLAFMLDLSNHRGNAGAKEHFEDAKAKLGIADPTEPQLMEKIEEIAPFPERRKFFGACQLLSLNKEFQEN